MIALKGVITVEMRVMIPKFQPLYHVDEIMICTDCNGSRVYQPLFGVAEPCGRCHGSGNEPLAVAKSTIANFTEGCVGELFLAQRDEEIHFGLERGQFYYRAYDVPLLHSYRLPDTGISVNDVFHDPVMYARTLVPGNMHTANHWTFRELTDRDYSVLGSETLCSHAKLMVYHPLDEVWYRVEVFMPIATTSGYSLNQKLHHHGGSLTCGYNHSTCYYELKVML